MYVLHLASHLPALRVILLQPFLFDEGLILHAPLVVVAVAALSPGPLPLTVLVVGRGGRRRVAAHTVRHDRSAARAAGADAALALTGVGDAAAASAAESAAAARDGALRDTTRRKVCVMKM